MERSSVDRIKQWLGNGSINIFGRPFAGKDTQGQRLADAFGGSLLGGGDILRNSVIPAHVDEVLRRGELIPSDDYVNIVLPYLSKDEFAGRPLVLSSVGRWLGEEKGVIAATEAAGHPLKAVVYLELDEQTVLERWKGLAIHDDRGGRYDDTESVLATRLEEYRQKTIPVIEQYESMGLLIRVDGKASPDEVYEAILRALEDKISRAE
jgi:adenylate kinase